MKQREIRMTIMSHLSDAQHLMEMGLMEKANKCINFAKLLLIEYHDVEVYATDEKLAELWDLI